MFEDAFTGLKSEVEPVVVRIPLFQRIHNAQALQVVLEARTLRVVRP